jgi:hypothetical protein
MRSTSLLGIVVLTGIFLSAPPMAITQAAASESFARPSDLQVLFDKTTNPSTNDTDKEKKCPTPPCGPKDK